MSVHQFWLRAGMYRCGPICNRITVSAEEIAIFYPADDCGKMAISVFAGLPTCLNLTHTVRDKLTLGKVRDARSVAPVRAQRGVRENLDGVPRLCRRPLR